MDPDVHEELMLPGEVPTQHKNSQKPFPESIFNCVQVLDIGKLITKLQNADFEKALSIKDLKNEQGMNLLHVAA